MPLGLTSQVSRISPRSLINLRNRASRLPLVSFRNLVNLVRRARLRGPASLTRQVNLAAWTLLTRQVSPRIRRSLTSPIVPMGRKSPIRRVHSRTLIRPRFLVLTMEVSPALIPATSKRLRPSTTRPAMTKRRPLLFLRRGILSDLSQALFWCLRWRAPSSSS